jgi:single-stranded DNA-binding protein
VRFESAGLQVCTFTLAVDERSYGEGRKPYTLFVPMTAAGKQAEACSLLQAADLVSVQGKLTWRKQMGKCKVEHSQLVVRVQDLVVLESDPVNPTTFRRGI